MKRATIEDIRKHEWFMKVKLYLQNNGLQKVCVFLFVCQTI